jgi:isoquinoline 1-oxidoreductase beta subunit
MPPPLRAAGTMNNPVAGHDVRAANTLALAAIEAADSALPSCAPRVRAVSRREFLRLSGAAGGGLMLAAYAPRSVRAANDPVTESKFAPNAFLRISADDSILIYAKGPELGQGIKTAFPLIVAEELDADWARVRVEQALVKPEIYGSQSAGGSRSIANNWDLLRHAGAVARAMLVAAAAKQWDVPPEACTTRDSMVMHADSGRRASYGQLASAAAALPVPADGNVALKQRKDYRLLGRRFGGIDNRQIVTGEPLFGIDQALPGMLFAVYEKSPAYGATVAHANVDEVRALPGVTDVFVVAGDSRGDAPPGVVIVATSTWAALKAKTSLEVTWNDAAASADSWNGAVATATALHRTRGAHTITASGDVDAAYRSASHTIEAFYTCPFVAHATAEPQNTTAWYRDGGIELWTPGQTADRGRDMVAKMLEVPVERVIVHQTRVGGGFGRRLMIDYTAEATLVARRVQAPVKLMWTREDDMTHDYYRVGGFHSFRGALDAQGRLSAWEEHFVTFTADGENPVAGGGLNADEFPAPLLPNVHITQTMLPLGTRCGPWRAPGDCTKAFAVQCFLHELAVTARRDHRDFLLEILGEPRWLAPQTDRALNTGRAIGVINLATEKAGWGRKLPKGRALGLAFHFCHAGHVAQVAEVSVSRDKKITVHRVTVACDFGPLVNLSGAEHQVLGAVCDGLSTMMSLEVTFEGGRIAQRNFGDYKQLRIANAPHVDAYFIESDFPPTGAGEPAFPPVAPAICNAIYTASGHRVRTLPLSREGFSI